MNQSNTASDSSSQARNVFVSHSSKDAKLASQVVKILEQMGTTCWVAPRDILSGKQYNQAILDGIKDSSVFLLLLSDDSNQSPHVEVEVERAFHYQKTIIPLRIKEVMPSKKLEYFISNAQWVDAFASPLHDRLNHVAAVVKALEMHASMPTIPAEIPTLSGRIRKMLEATQRNMLIVASVAVVLFSAATYLTVSNAPIGGVSPGDLDKAMVDVERQTSDDPRKELSKRGLLWHPMQFFHVAVAGDLEAAKLFRQAGMTKLLDYSQTCMGLSKLLFEYAGPADLEADIWEEVIKAVGDKTVKECTPLRFGAQEMSMGIYPVQTVQTLKKAIDYYLTAYKADNHALGSTLSGFEISPLIGATWMDKPGLVKMFLKHGADSNRGIDAMNTPGPIKVDISPLSEAMRLGNQEIARILKENGAKEIRTGIPGVSG